MSRRTVRRSAVLLLSVLTMAAVLAPTARAAPINGSFEDGATGWDILGNVTIGAPPSAPPGITAHDGANVAILPDDDLTQALDQPNVTVPPAAPYLIYHIWVVSNELYCDVDYGGVALVPTIPALDTIARQHPLCISGQTVGWARHVLDARPLAGQVVTLEIVTGTTGATANSVLIVDDLAFAAAPGEPAYLPAIYREDTPTPAPPTPTPEPTAEPTVLPPLCDPAYPTVCIPPPPPDLDCGDIPYRRFAVLPPDPHGFDSDGDGVGCESG